jgi:LysR family nitrogen assimilation transcriptional regulator
MSIVSTSLSYSRNVCDLPMRELAVLDAFDVVSRGIVWRLLKMDIRQLKYFVAVAESGSVSGAAQRVHIAQPSLSQHIRQMEGELGATLFMRGPRGMVPTEAGERLLNHARLILAHFESARDEIRGSQMQPAGEVRLGISPTAADVLSVPLVEDLAKRFPQIRICLVEAMSGFLLDFLRDGRINLAIIYRQPATHWVTCRHLLTDQMSLVGPVDAKVNEVSPGCIEFAGIERRPLILPSAAHGLRELIDEIAARERVRLDVLIEMDGFSQIKTLCARGHGFSILPTVAVRDDVREGKLQAWRIVNPTIERNLYLAYPADRPLSNAAIVVERLCSELIERLVSTGEWLTAVRPNSEP